MWNKSKSWLLMLIDFEEPFIYGILLIIALVGSIYISTKYPNNTPNDVLQNQRIEQLEQRLTNLEQVVNNINNNK